MNTSTLPRPWRFALDRHDDPQPAPAPAPEPDPAADPAPEPTPEPDRPLGPAGEKALEEWKRRAKEAEAAARANAERIREFEDRDKTELQRAQEAAARATAEAEAVRAELLRSRILAEHGLTAEDAEFLPAGAEDDMRAAAQRLAERLAAAAPQKPAGPRPDPSQGSGRPVVPTDFRTASRDDFAAELAKYGLRPRQ